MVRKAAIGLCTLALLATMTACGGNKNNNAATNPPAAGAPAGGTEASAEVLALYKANCVGCHGDNLEGRMGGNSNLQKVGARRTKEVIATQIANGGNGMPGYKGKLKENEINALADWLAAKK